MNSLQSIRDDLNFIKTSDICPEQYDVFYHDEQVAYVRARHGILTVACPDVSGIKVFTQTTDIEGTLSTPAGVSVMNQVKDAIAEWVLNRNDS